ncbi:septum formation initiator family protein [Isoptericola sp. b408]|uniref:FtsB family cell division protein n=1 Tax=Isoptericola sp. b408 TaxID=3064653 RepID=UPI00271321C8|nr:septum formation initiator family protein [Isoptericola sp. b408]MDO8152396.1 septum formation initiator family protein [Isoptericola sp. b408]
MSSRRPTTPRPRRGPTRPTGHPGPRPSSRSTGGRTRTTSSASATAGASRRPAGPSRDERRRSRFGLVLPEVLTVRLIVLSVVVLLAFVLLLPTVRGAVQQQAEIDRLRAELTANQAERDQLENELARWDDRTYVIQQARSRLNYVLPGDTAWRVVDAEEIEQDDEPVTGADPTPDVGAGTTGAPWYQAMWESVQAADRAVVDPGSGLDPADVETPGPGEGQ